VLNSEPLSFSSPLDTGPATFCNRAPKLVTVSKLREMVDMLHGDTRAVGTCRLMELAAFMLALSTNPPNVCGIPTTWSAEYSIGCVRGMPNAFMGLSRMPCPTFGWSMTTGMLSAVSCSAGPIPLHMRRWGLPNAPAATMTSLPALCVKFA